MAAPMGPETGRGGRNWDSRERLRDSADWVRGRGRRARVPSSSSAGRRPPGTPPATSEVVFDGAWAMLPESLKVPARLCPATAREPRGVSVPAQVTSASARVHRVVQKLQCDPAVG